MRYMTQRNYEIVLDPQQDGGFSVYVPELPDVVTEGETREEAIEMAKEAIKLYLQTMAEQGWEPHRVERVEVAVAA